MRLRLVHTLALTLLLAVAVAVVAMGAVTAWNLGQGFSAFLRSRDEERLEQFARLVSERAQQAGGAAALSDGRLSMRALLQEFASLEGLPPQSSADDGRRGPPPREGGPPPREGGPPPEASPEGPPRQGPPPNGPDPEPARGRNEGPQGAWRAVQGFVFGPKFPPPPGAEGTFGSRVMVVGLDERPLLGRPLPPQSVALLRRAVQLDGQTVAWVLMRPSHPVPNAVEARFLRSQYLGIAGVALALVALALVSAWWLTRRWVRPLLAVQDATARMARGEFNVRLSDARSDEIGDVVRNVNHMAESLQRLEGARRRWVADISHELRTPLAVLRGEVEALLDGVRPLSHQAMVSLREEVMRLSALVDDLHLLAMSDLSALPCHLAPCDVGELLAKVVQRFAPRAQSAGLSLQLEELAPEGEATAQAPTGASSPCLAQWDAARMEQLLGNLLENCLRYTDVPGQVQLQWLRPAASRAEVAARNVRITVQDSAPGVPAADVPRLFEPLYRADAARSRHRGGSGLGLAICEAIARAHGGHMAASASPLGGLKVTMELPLEPQTAA